MAHMLEQKIGQVRRRARRLLLLHAVSWTLATVLTAVLLVALADYLIRFEDRGLRLMASLAVLAAVAGAGYRFLWSGLGGLRLGDVQIAQRIERRFPSLGDRLESAIQFIKQPELEIGAGSAALRRAVIIDTESQVAELDVDQVIQPAPARRAAACAGVIAMIAAVLVAVSPASAKIALARLARPLADDAWPRYYHLEFKAPPARIAAGQNFEVELLHDAQHRLPDVVEMQYRYQTGPDGYEIESEPMRWLNGALVARKDNVQRPFEYRATGGDDDTMPWRRLEVLEAPRIAQLGVTLHPPQYTGLPVEESDKAIHAIQGTRVALQGTVTKQVAKATLRHEDGGELPLEVAADGNSIALRPEAPQPWIVEKTGQYWIELVDDAGLTGGSDERWDVRSIADLEPTVTIEKPATNSYVTPQGELELAIAVKDDLAIRSVALHFGRSDREDVPDFAVPLFQGEFAGPRYAEPGLLLGGKLGESRVVTHTWRLAELELKPGTQVTFWATASDYVPQDGKSTPRSVTIITPAELEERLAQRQTLVVGELQRVLKLQQDARSQTRSLDIQVNQVAEFSKQEIDQAQSAELNQRQVDRTLTSPTEGIPAQIHEFLNELRANHVDSPGAMRQMTSILEEVERLEREHLGEVEAELTGFIKAAQAKLAEDKPPEGQPQATSNAKPDEAMRERLASAGEHQDAVIDSLESLVDELGRWDNFRRFSRAVAELERQQEEIAKATQELAPQTLGREFKELGEQQQADLKKLSSQQSELGRRLEKTQQQMGEMSRSLEQNDPIAAATIEDGLHHAREQAISDKMRESSASLEKNQLGQSAGLQEKVASELKELQSILSNRKEQELSRLVKQLRDAEGEMARLREQQAGLRKKLKEAEKIADPAERKRELERLSREQKKLAEEAQRLSRKLQRLQADKAGGKTAAASNKMSQAGENSESGDGEAAGEQAANAERDLEEAEQQLAQRRKQAETDLAREQLARMDDSLKGLHERQQKLIQESQRLEQLRAAEGRLSRAQLATLGDLARLQQALGGETSQLAEKLELTEVIHLALSGAADKMQRAAELLELRDTGLPTQSAQEAARQRLAQLLAAFEKKQHPQKPGGKQGGGSGSGGGESGRPDGKFVLAQLKLLKLLQEDLNQRYREATTDDDTSSREVRRELVEIAAEQGKLAELTLKLSEPPADAPEDTPDELPDVRESEPPLDGLPELELPDLDAPLGESTPSVPPPDASLDARSEEKP